uniref:Host determinant protein n=1 Tax=Lactococcus phage CHL92 TaxID=197314 RepID=Q8H9Y9_9CAUD|nr:host determinant protein [Lactococcus phage CHL92]
MFSWLNFEELLIHNPIELINPSKDTISVAMNKKQYIDFFSNKYTYNGVYYDEEMDFCLFYYADPLQSYKDGDVYAQGYIDVEMKIYRVKWLCNVSISRFNPNFNLLEGTKDFSGDWINSSSWLTTGTYKNLTVKTQNVPWTAISKKFTVSIPGTYTISEHVRNIGSSPVQSYLILNGKINDAKDDGTRFDWKVVSFTRTLSAGDVIALETHNGTTGQISVAGYKVEQGSTATPYMPSESETTSADLPKWNVSKTEMVVNTKAKTITTVLNGALSKCTKDKDITGWLNSQPNANYNYRQPQYSLDIGTDDFIISGYGLRGLKNG